MSCHLHNLDAICCIFPFFICFASGFGFQLDMTNLRRSTRQRRVSVNLGDYTDSSGSQDEDLMVRLIANE